MNGDTMAGDTMIVGHDDWGQNDGWTMIGGHNDWGHNDRGTQWQGTQ